MLWMNCFILCDIFDVSSAFFFNFVISYHAIITIHILFSLFFFVLFCSICVTFAKYRIFVKFICWCCVSNCNWRLTCSNVNVSFRNSEFFFAWSCYLNGIIELCVQSDLIVWHNKTLHQCALHLSIETICAVTTINGSIHINGWIIIIITIDMQE